ncbi:MAG TPA: ABC transporter permease, partial [Gammaproteobacteria bacterium]|nr:ABC transporter permease [Gammaproteobacteria bacterium]
MPVIFITDALIFILLVVAGLFAWYSSRHEHLRAPWRQVAHNPMAMASAVLLFFYIVIGLLDSVHFHPLIENSQTGERQYASEIRSLLDELTVPLQEKTERTYSAPFAARSFSSEMIELPDGSEIRGYPRLEYGGSHLSDPERERGTDILLKTVTGVIFGILIWLIVAGIIIRLLAFTDTVTFKKEVARIAGREKNIPWHVILLTLAGVIVVATAVAYLSAFYHVLGTDKVGQDVLYNALKSVRTGLLIGT